MTEIETDYLLATGVQRVQTTALAAGLPGSGTLAGYTWTATQDNFPDAWLDTDDPDYEPEGAPTLRGSTTQDGSGQTGIKIVKWLPAAGGVAGGARAEVKVNLGTYLAGSDNPFWFYRIIGGTQVQPGDGDLYGADESTAGSKFWSVDGGKTDISPDHNMQICTGVLIYPDDIIKQHGILQESFTVDYLLIEAP